MATRNIVPRANEEGSLGTAAKKWNEVHAKTVYADSLNYTIPDASDTVKGIVELATDAEVNTGIDTDRAVTPAGLAQRAATTAMAGIVELATDAEAITGIDAVRAVTPAALKAALDDINIEDMAAANVSISVGATGDFATLNAALAYLSTLKPQYNSSNIIATITMQAGFVMQEQVLVRGVDLSWVTITGIDAETLVALTSLTTAFGVAYGITSYPAFGAIYGGKLPVLNQIFNMGTSGTKNYRDGVMVAGAGSCAQIVATGGIREAASRAIHAEFGGLVVAGPGVALTDAVDVGVVASNGAKVVVPDAYITGAGFFGVYAKLFGTIHAANADATRSGSGTTGDYVVVNGGIIYKNSGRGTADTNVPTLNTFTHRGAIIGT